MHIPHSAGAAWELRLARAVRSVRGVRRGHGACGEASVHAVSGVSEAVFARHANPWSAWTRWLSTPLMLIPIWTRRWSHATVVGGWLLLNPVAFPPPRGDRAWSTRAMLGEEMWIHDRPKDTALVLNIAATGAGCIAVLAARRRWAGVVVAATAGEMALLLMYWKLMVDYYERQRAAELTRDRDGSTWRDAPV